MCMTVPGKVLDISEDKALVDFSGLKKHVSTELVTPKKGDYILAYADYIMEIIDEKKAKAMITGLLKNVPNKK